ncbi:hypothetical protein Gotur_026318 [Gossypium turneri]
MAHKIKQLNQKLHEIATLKNNFHLVERHDCPRHDRHSEREAHSFEQKSKDDLTDVEGMHVLPIVGVGDMGKTTLAKLIFNDETLDAHFELKLWACVFDDFDLKWLAVKAIKTGKSSDGDLGSLDLELLQKALQVYLNVKKYLLVLAYMCNEDNRKWVELKHLFVGGVVGSKIVVTTRSSQVAKIIKRGRGITSNPSGNRGRNCKKMQRGSFGSEEIGVTPRILGLEEIGFEKGNS